MKPLLFNSEMIRAVLEGRKWITRRKLKNVELIQEVTRYEAKKDYYLTEQVKLSDADEHGQVRFASFPFGALDCPFGKIGDKVVAKCDDLPEISLLIEITGLKVEKLNKISEGDVMAEGCFMTVNDEGRPIYNFNKEEIEQELGYHKAQEAFKVLWNSIYKNHPTTESWEANPWVWRIEFRPVIGEIYKSL